MEVRCRWEAEGQLILRKSARENRSRYDACRQQTHARLTQTHADTVAAVCECVCATLCLSCVASYGGGL